MPATSAETLHRELVIATADERFSEATLQFRDGSRLCFCHRVDQRWAKAVGPDRQRDPSGSASDLLTAMTLFRLNAKHLDIEFQDGSRWDERLQNWM